MAPLAQETMKYTEQEEKLFRELDKGIDDMEKEIPCHMRIP